MGKHRQLAAIVAFNIMCTMVTFAVLDFIVSAYYAAVDDDVLDVSFSITFGIVALVFLVLWLSAKRKGHVY